MGKINKALLMVIAMVAIMIVAVGIDKGMEYYSAVKWEQERVERYEMARADVAEIQMTISELSQDQEAIEAFIEENKEFFENTAIAEEPGSESAEDAGKEETEQTLGEQPEQAIEDGTEDRGKGMAEQQDVSENFAEDVSGNRIEDVSENTVSDVSGNGLNDVSGNELGDVSGNGLGDVSGNALGDVSGNELRDVSGNGLEDISGNGLEDALETAVQDKQDKRGSYAETISQNQKDQKIIAQSQFDFSDMTITCLGDSITAAANLEKMENYQQYAYPTRLQSILGAEKVTNLGIGGSSIGRYWENAFVDRYQEIPEDTDLIIVMGGTNDGFCMTETEFGTIEERKEKTFIGDLDELLRGLKEDYPDAMIILATPPSNVLHDMLRKENTQLLPQSQIVAAMKQLAAEYEIPVIDLYNSNLLDTHDAAVIYNYMPDGVHCNQEGYEILAQHFAAELIRLYESPEEAKEQNEDDLEGQSEEIEEEQGEDTFEEQENVAESRE